MTNILDAEIAWGWNANSSWCLVRALFMAEESPEGANCKASTPNWQRHDLTGLMVLGSRLPIQIYAVICHDGRKSNTGTSLQALHSQSCIIPDTRNPEKEMKSASTPKLLMDLLLAWDKARTAAISLEIEGQSGHSSVCTHHTMPKTNQPYLGSQMSEISWG